MLEKFVLCDSGLENCVQGGEKTGYRVKLGIPYYRSVPLSCIEEISLMVDNEDVDPASVTLELGGSRYTLAELAGKMDVWWGFQEKGFLAVQCGDGLPLGKHKVKVHFVIRVPYLIPVNGGFVPNYDVTNAVKFLEVTA